MYKQLYQLNRNTKHNIDNYFVMTYKPTLHPLFVINVQF